VSGERSRHLVAFARRHPSGTAIAIVPRLVTGLGVKTGELPTGAQIWGDTRLELPFLDAATELRDALTGSVHRIENGGLSVAAVLARLPVAVLVG
jgi:(1->4)-alpha-D-glucan 1-alpha-D-glucosylmutase